VDKPADCAVTLLADLAGGAQVVELPEGEAIDRRVVTQEFLRVCRRQQGTEGERLPPYSFAIQLTAHRVRRASVPCVVVESLAVTALAG